MKMNTLGHGDKFCRLHPMSAALDRERETGKEGKTHSERERERGRESKGHTKSPTDSQEQGGQERASSCKFSSYTDHHHERGGEDLGIKKRGRCDQKIRDKPKTC